NATAPAVPGHNFPARDGFDAYVDWLVAEASLLPRPVHLVGYSAGGRIVAGALAKGVACDAATLISTNLGLGSPAEREARALTDARWSALLRERGIDAFVDAWEAQPLFASQAAMPETSRAWQRMARTSLDPNALADAMDALSLARMPDLHEAMRGVTLPWQVVVGALDAKFIALAHAMSAPGVVELADCGHNPLLEAPELLAASLNNFVRGLV
ncbi:MAG TPA: alpha/beta fold hydrolase, partial [Myxococcota bacterium]|nr:alpha/beta fold hydrolase [Myxococcota bacterium]